jgi:hypothetical protein
MNALRWSIAIATLIAVAWLAPVHADDRRPYVGAGAMLTIQGSHPPAPNSPDFPRTGVGGVAPGLTAEVGGFLTATVSIAFEASLAARFTSIQETDYSIVFRDENRHRDEIFSGLFHFHLPGHGRFGAAIVGGPSVVHENTLRRTAYQTDLPPDIRSGHFGPFGPEYSVRRWTIGVTGGVDLAFDTGARVSVVPQIRVHWIERSAVDGSFSGSLGLSSWVFRPAIGVRMRF